jgi:RNA polymerase sigma-70 factor (ECF subfamily)
MHDREARIAWFKAEILPHEAALRRRLARARLTPSEIDDLVAESETRAYAGEAWSSVENGRAYLFAIARNLMVTAARRRKVVSLEAMADLEVLGRADEQPAADAVVSSRQELRRLQAAVGALPEKARQVFIRRRIDGIPAERVADELGVGVSTIDKHLAKAMALLTRAMAEHEPMSQSQSKSAWRPGRQKR